MSNIFYSKSGTPVAYIEDGCHIFRFSGECVGYIFEDSIFSFSGRHLGFFKDGWIRDINGKCVLFIRNAKNGPERRRKDIGRIKNQKSKIPIKKPREKQPKKLEIKQEWSELSFPQFFDKK